MAIEEKPARHAESVYRNSDEEKLVELHSPFILDELRQRAREGASYMSPRELAQQRLTQAEISEQEVSRLAALIQSRLMREHRDEIRKAESGAAS